MTQIFNVNPFAEAMIYYFGRANDNRVEKRFAEAMKLHPEHKETLEKMLSPVVALEQKLDSELTVDDALVNKYFKRLDNLNSRLPFGFCIASIMVCFPLMAHLEYSTDEMCKYLRECNIKERMYSLCFGLINTCETLYTDESGIEEFSQQLENIQLPLEDKWKIQSAAFNYRKHIEELTSLITPAADLISASLDEFNDIVKNFHARYSVDNAQEFLGSQFGRSDFEFKFTPVDVMNVAPLLFGFDDMWSEFHTNNADIFASDDRSDNSHSFGRTFLGIARHIIKRTPHDEVSALSEKMKALSDSTRLEILFYLCNHREYGQELCARFGLQRSALSYHMTKLLTAGFVTGELVGIQTYYTTDKEGIRRTFDAFMEKIK